MFTLQAVQFFICLAICLYFCNFFCTHLNVDVFFAGCAFFIYLFIYLFIMLWLVILFLAAVFKQRL